MAPSDTNPVAEIEPLTGAYTDESPEGSGRRVLQVVSGPLAEGPIVVRSVGGRVGDYEVEYRDAVEFLADTEYVLLLERIDTPTRDGTQEMWVTVNLGHGVFASGADGRWRNMLGLEFPSAELKG